MVTDIGIAVTRGTSTMKCRTFRDEVVDDERCTIAQIGIVHAKPAFCADKPHNAVLQNCQPSTHVLKIPTKGWETLTT